MLLIGTFEAGASEHYEWDDRLANFIKSSSSARLRTRRSWAAALSNPDWLSWRTAEP